LKRRKREREERLKEEINNKMRRSRRTSPRLINQNLQQIELEQSQLPQIMLITISSQL